MCEFKCRGYYLLAEPCDKVMQFFILKTSVLNIIHLEVGINYFFSGESRFHRRVVFSLDGRIIRPSWENTTILGKYDHPVKMRLVFSQEGRIFPGESYFPRRVVFSQEGRIFPRGSYFPRRVVFPFLQDSGAN